VEYENNQKKFESVYSEKVRAGKRRTYFFDVRRTKGNDFYVTLTESTRKFEEGGYERHKIFLYKEDFNRFMTALQGTINHVKTELMPDYDYDEFTRRQEEYEEKRRLEDAEGISSRPVSEAPKVEEPKAEAPKADKADDSEKDTPSEPSSEDDMSW
jgi:hypothetical protein